MKRRFGFEASVCCGLRCALAKLVVNYSTTICLRTTVRKPNSQRVTMWDDVEVVVKATVEDAVECSRCGGQEADEVADPEGELDVAQDAECPWRAACLDLNFGRRV